MQVPRRKNPKSNHNQKFVEKTGAIVQRTQGKISSVRNANSKKAGAGKLK